MVSVALFCMHPKVQPRAAADHSTRVEKEQSGNEEPHPLYLHCCVLFKEASAPP